MCNATVGLQFEKYHILFPQANAFLPHKENTFISTSHGCLFFKQSYLIVKISEAFILTI